MFGRMAPWGVSLRALVVTSLILLTAASRIFGAGSAISPVTPVSALTLEESLAIALENNNDLITARTALMQANRAAKAAWNDFLPQITATAGIGHTHTLMPAANNEFSWNGGAGATLTLTTAIPARAKQPVLAAQKAQADYDNKELTLKADVAKAFYKLISDKANVDILRANQTLTQQQYEQLRRNYNSGLASELDMLNAQYSYQAAGPALTEAQNSYNEHAASFLFLLGLDPAQSQDFTPKGDIDTSRAAKAALPSWQELADKYGTGRYDVVLQGIAVEQARVAARIAGAAKAPSLSLGETFRVQGASEKDITLGGTFSLNLTIPISAWIPISSTALSAKKAKEDTGTAALKLEQVRRNALQDIKLKADAVERYRSNLEVTALNVRISQRAHTLSVQGYRAGMVSQTDLQAANQRLVTAEQTSLTAQVNFLAAFYDLATALQVELDVLMSDE
jgi:outer membrane protein TolC